MKIGVYNESSRNDGIIGGSEAMAAVLADALAGEYVVEFVHHRESLTKDGLAGVAGTALSEVTLRYVPADDSDLSANCSFRRPRARYHLARQWHAELSNPYDLFINIGHNMPPFCHAPHGVLVVLFPFFQPSVRKPKPQPSFKLPYHLWGRAYLDWEWGRRLKSYQQYTAISQFSARWTQQRWGFPCEVIYPPVDGGFEPRAKTNRILSVGRFSGRGVLKRQLEMLTAFRDMEDGDLAAWQYSTVGGRGEVAEDVAYFEKVQALATPGRAEVRGNVPRSELKTLYEDAKIFWHATGYGEDEQRHPDFSEHFGIVTAEAMAAGCIPIVINKGAQPEIVEHGVSGFLWSTLEELKEYTALVAGDDDLRETMSQAARLRAQFFSREEFVRRFRQFLKPLLP